MLGWPVYNAYVYLEIALLQELLKLCHSVLRENTILYFHMYFPQETQALHLIFTYIYLFLASYAVSNSFAQAAAIWCYLIVSLGGLLSQFREIRFWWKNCLTGKNTVSHCLLNLVGSAYNWKIFSIAKEMCGIYQTHSKMYKYKSIYHYQLHRRECAGGK